MGQACPGCGREYTRRDGLCVCGYAQDAVRWAERPRTPPPAWTAYREGLRREREQREREREQREREREERDRARRVREAEEALADARALQEEIARRRAARNEGAKRVVTPAPQPKSTEPEPKNTPTQPSDPAPATKKHRKTTQPDQPQMPPVPLPDRLRRAAHIERLTCESRFLDQRTQAAHRNFLKILEEIYPYEPGYGEWPEPVPEHRWGWT